jgi:hypothetical protein
MLSRKVPSNEYHQIFLIKLLFLFLAFPTSVHAVTLVYNLRIRRAFNFESLPEQTRTRWPLSVVPIFYARSSHGLIDVQNNTTVDEKRRVGAALVNLRCVPNKHWFFEGTTAIENEHANFKGIHGFNASRTGLDDLVFSGGYRYFAGDNVQLVGYGLAGFPLGRKIDECDKFTPLVGTRLYTLGLGGEISYSFVSERSHSCAAIFQGRFLHSFNRSWFPILPEGSKIQPGNVSDLFFILQTRYHLTVFELGYDLTLFTNQAIILPTQTIDAKTLARHSAEASVTHAWLETPLGKPCVLGLGVSASHSKKFDSNVVTIWLNGTIVF